MNAGDISFKLTIDGKDFNIGLKEAGLLLREFQRNSEQTARSVKRLEDTHHSLATKFRHLVLTLGNLRFALMDLYDVFLRLPQQILETAGNLEKMQKLMEGLSNQATKSAREIEAASNFRFLTQMAQSAPFQISALAESFVKLKAGGIDPTNGSMQALVDSVARFGGSSDSLKRASVAIQQMAGKGVVSMEELRQQLGEAIPDAMQAMAVGTGLSMAKLAKLVSDGVVEATSAIDRMLTVLALKNRGAAAEMLNTFNGALDQLKTQFQLAGKTIGDAGFSKEVIAVMKEVTAMMQSSDFRRFAKDLGGTLGDAVRVIASAVRAAYEFRDALIAIVEAFILYKVSVGIFQPNLVAAKQAYESLGKTAVDVRSKLLSGAAAQREAAIQEQVAARDRAIAAQTAARAAIEAKQQEVAAIRAMNAQLAGEAAALQASMNRSFAVPVPNKPGIFTLVSPDRTAELQKVNALMDQNNAKLRQGANELAQHGAAARIAEIAAAGHAEQMRRLGGQVDNVTRATQALGMAQRAMQGLWGLMGGWLGVINIALTAGIALWFNYANAIREADARMRRLRQGVSSEDDVRDFAEKLAGVAARRATLQTAVENLEIKLANTTNPKLRETYQKTLNDTRSQLQEVNSDFIRRSMELARARQNLIQQQADEESSAYQRSFERSVKEIEQGYKAKIDAETLRFKELKDKAAGNQKELSKIAKDENAFYAQIGKERATELQKVISTEIEVQKRRRDISAELRSQNVQYLEGQLDQVKRDATKAGNLLKDIVLSKPDKNEGRFKTPIETFIDGLKEQRAELFNEVDQLEQGTDRLSEVEKALAGFRARTGKDSKSFKYEVKDKEFGPTDAQKAEAERLVRETAGLQQLVKDAEKIMTEARKLGPDYVEALETISNPFGTIKTSKSNRIDELRANLSDLQKVLKDMSLSEADAARVTAMINNVNAALNGASSKAATVDLASNYKKLVEQNQRMSSEVIVSDRERSREKIRLADEEAQAVIASLKKQLQAADTTEKQRADIEAQIAKNKRLRAALAAEAAKTPMQKLLDEWGRTTERMEQMTVNWANASIDAFVNFARTGKLEFGDLIKSMLADLLKLKLQQSMGGSLDALFSAGLGWLSGALFANGGIMTGAGPAGLRKYAAGGIANSPQLALFGEGSTPEAYVPLPDGRTIPVTLNSAGAGGGGNVVVNVINQTSQPVTATKGQPRFDGKQMILDVVLSAASQPGPFRDGMQSMMKGR